MFESAPIGSLGHRECSLLMCIDQEELPNSIEGIAVKLVLCTTNDVPATKDPQETL